MLTHAYTIAVSATYNPKTCRWHGWRAYVLWYNTAWPNLCTHTVHARRKSEARQLAIAEFDMLPAVNGEDSRVTRFLLPSAEAPQA